MCEQGLARSGGPDKQNVALLKLNIFGVKVVHNSLIVIMHRHRDDLLGMLLRDDVLIEGFFDFLGGWQAPNALEGILFSLEHLVATQTLAALAYALVADIGTCNSLLLWQPLKERLYRVLIFSAKRAT